MVLGAGGDGAREGDLTQAGLKHSSLPIPAPSHQAASSCSTCLNTTRVFAASSPKARHTGLKASDST